MPLTRLEGLVPAQKCVINRFVIIPEIYLWAELGRTLRCMWLMLCVTSGYASKGDGSTASCSSTPHSCSTEVSNSGSRIEVLDSIIEDLR